MENKKWDFVDRKAVQPAEDTRPSLTYWSDVWRRFRTNKMALIGLVLITIIVMVAIIGPMLSPFSYEEQVLEYGNMPPRLAIHKVTDEIYIYVHQDFKLIRVTSKGELVSGMRPTTNDAANKTRAYDYDGHEVTLDYGTPDAASGLGYTVLLDGKPIDLTAPKNVSNKTNPLGTDKLGRDVWVRVLYGARISLMVGVAAALVNAIVGILYGGIAGYKGGKLDNVMMRFVDLLNSIPLMIIVILVMVATNKTGLGVIIVTIGMVYWVGMARQVRGQVMSLKEQEFVLAARTLGASSKRIIFKHLVPNSMGPIIVTMMMSIPSAIFTESFLSFVGLGVSAPMASWGTLANDALGGIRSFPYLLIVPSIAIALTIFAFNFVGDGLRDALDPKQRK